MWQTSSFVASVYERSSGVLSILSLQTGNGVPHRPAPPPQPLMAALEADLPQHFLYSAQAAHGTGKAQDVCLGGLGASVNYKL